MVKSLLQARDIRLKKSLGQHFLCDENILKLIVEAAELKEEDIVVEIGSGIGTLTQKLAEQSKTVVAVEIDQRLIPILISNVASNVSVLNEDFLKVDIKEIAEHHKAKKVKVIGNLPYQATSPILEKLIKKQDVIDLAVLMIQHEVAEKITSKPGPNHSSLGVFVKAFVDVELLKWVSKNVFFPKPEVDSCLIKLSFLERPRFSSNEEMFFKVVKSAFNLRRKTIKKALMQSPFLELSEEVVIWALKKAGIDPKRRGETLDMGEFDRLTSAIESCLGKV